MSLAVMLSVTGAGSQGMPGGAPAASSDQPAPGILTRAQAGAIFPATVFYRGLTATIQQRNAGGVKLADGHLVLMAVVDTSGYASDVRAVYAAYLLTEVPLEIGTKTLAAGAYGMGFPAGDQFVVTDLGGQEVLRVAVAADAAMTRPAPLQILPGRTAGSYRACFGRQCVGFSEAKAQR